MDSERKTLLDLLWLLGLGWHRNEHERRKIPARLYAFHFRSGNEAGPRWMKHPGPGVVVALRQYYQAAARVGFGSDSAVRFGRAARQLYPHRRTFATTPSRCRANSRRAGGRGKQHRRLSGGDALPSRLWNGPGEENGAFFVSSICESSDRSLEWSVAPKKCRLLLMCGPADPGSLR